MDQTDVLVVGGGPTGLTLASELARYGVDFRIIDSGRAATDLSKAIGIQPRTLEVMDIMGIADELVPHGNPAKSFHIYDEGANIVNLDFTRIVGRFPYLLVTPQSDTERVLEDHLRNRGGEVERNTRLTGFSQDENGVTATIARMDTGSEEIVRARWLVGCDGAHSVVRHGLNLPFEGEEYEDGFLLADVHVEWDRPNDELYLLLHEGLLLVLFPLPGGHCRMIADLTGVRASADQTPSLEECQRIVDERSPFPAKLSDPRWTAYYRIHRRIVPKLSEGRVHLAGDAAHIHSPAAAQGMNTGIQDSFNLSWKLALAARGMASETLLDSYNAERYPVEHGVLTMTDTLLKLVSLRQPLARKIRDAILPMISSTSLFQELLAGRVSETAIDYHHSPIVVDRDHGHAPHAGLRAPDGLIELPDGQSKRLYEILRDGQFVLLTFTGHDDYTGDTLAKSIDAALNTIRVPIRRFQIVDGALRSSFGITHAGLRLIRPDGYIGLRSNVENAEAALRGWAAMVFANP